MALLETEECGGVRLAMWTPLEETDVLEVLLGNAVMCSHIKTSTASDKRRKELLTAHILLKHITGRDCVIEHDEGGKPFSLELGMNISVSHCSRCIAVAVSNEAVGIDVENIGCRQMAVAEKFLSVVERGYLSAVADRDRYAALLWSVKEAVYKLVSVNGLSFVDDISVPYFILHNEGVLPAYCNTGAERRGIVLFYRFYPNFISVIARFGEV
ncbi:MAG: 4'-phosphopantetheinyl transferase superfamily protein [Bacteroidales bacterium]